MVAATVWERTAVPPAAPTVAYTLLNGRAGHSDDWRGKVMRVNLRATSCAACRREMPDLVATHRKYRAKGLDTLAVAMRHDAPANVVHDAESRQRPFGVAIDNTGEIARAFGGVAATPTTLLVDRRGRIVWRGSGVPDCAALHREIEGLLGEG